MMDSRKTQEKLDKNVMLTTGIFTLRKIHKLVDEYQCQEQKSRRLFLFGVVLLLLAVVVLVAIISIRSTSPVG